MKFTFCPDCGARLTTRDLGDDKDIPWCTLCNKPWFPIFSTCIIALVYNDKKEVLLLRQNYISSVYANLVSGYMQPGENAENAAKREILEETGLEVSDLECAGTYWFAKKDMLMIGFTARAINPDTLRLSSEVDSAAWYPAAESVSLVHPNGSVSHTLCALYLNSLKSNK